MAWSLMTESASEPRQSTVDGSMCRGQEGLYIDASSGLARRLLPCTCMTWIVRCATGNVADLLSPLADSFRSCE
jgi:hypothetical protein